MQSTIVSGVELSQIARSRNPGILPRARKATAWGFRICRRPTRFLATMMVATLSCLGAIAHAGSLEEISVVFHPAIFKQLSDESELNVTAELMRRFGLGDPLRHEKSGAITFAIPSDLSREDARRLTQAIERSPGVLAAAVSSTPTVRRQIEAVRAFAQTSEDRNVVGLIIKYRVPELVTLSRNNGVLPAEELARLRGLMGTSLVGSRAMSGDAFVVNFDEPVTLTNALQMARLLDNDPNIVHTSPNEIVQAHLVPNDTNFNLQWSLTNPTGGIDAPKAWDLTTGSANTVVAVVDTGILAHPEFAGRILQGYDFISDPRRSNDGDGRDASATDAGDWVPANYCGTGTPAKNSSWHGTHVAGIIAATGNNGSGIAGLDWRTRILPVRVLGRCGGDTADIVDGMRWAAGLPVPGVPANPTPARVINMSLGGNTPCYLKPAEQEATIEILAVGAALVVSAGNSNDDAANYSPAGCFGVLTIGATGPTGDRASYSNYGDLTLDLSAPGGDSGAGILSTFATGTQSDPGNATWAYKQGTSQAAPHVSGTVALMLAVNPSLTIAQIRDILRGTAKPFAAGTICAQRGDCGYGLLNASTAVDYARTFVGVKWNFTDHWFNPPESGWGIQVTAEGQMLFVTWYTYGSDGLPRWLTMQLSRQGQDIFSGDIYATTGVPYMNINGREVTTSVNIVGTATLFFYGHFEGALIYTLGNVTTVKPIQRLEFGSPLTFCSYTTASRAGDTNYQDMWWNPPESGWGINLTHQGNVIFATWFTYDTNGIPLWLYLVATKESQNRFSGRMSATTGVPLSLVNGSKALLSTTDVGSGSLTFISGEQARFDYNVLGNTGSKPIVRQVFASPVTHCEPY